MLQSRKLPPSFISIPIARNKIAQNSTLARVLTEPPDSLPVTGKSAKSPNVFYAFGHGHVGMTGVPMTAKVVIELVSGEPPSIDVSPFPLLRFH
jgi:glycine/D-amino acid oxidase-like deaminating enzyme